MKHLPLLYTIFVGTNKLLYKPMHSNAIFSKNDHELNGCSAASRAEHLYM